MKSLANRLPDIVLHKRLLITIISIVGVFCLGFAYPVFLILGKIALICILLLLVIDFSLLYSHKKPVGGSRVMENKLSNGDFNPVIIQLTGRYGFTTEVEVIDELPNQLQKRDLALVRRCPPRFREDFLYEIRPTQRGVYQFGDIRVFIGTQFKLITRRVTISAQKEAKVYPSFIQYRKYSFLAISNRLEEVGVKKVRQIGSNKEYEQIREYVKGDDFRVINWKATARKNTLMVNQYQEEKSQNVYCLVDKGRLMHMPFEGLTLMDYSINAALVVSGIAMGRGDKAGLVTFSDKIGSFIMAKSKQTQLQSISDALYDQDVRLRESDYLRLYKNIRLKIKKRSLLILFTNFDSVVSLNRQLSFLKALSRNHLLVTVIFDNSEINELADKKAFSIKDTYYQTIAEKFQYDKFSIIKELRKNGIYTILTEPKNLTVNAINKYIEIKAMGAL